MSGLGVVGVTGVSVPATMAAVDTSDRNSLFGDLYNIAKNAYKKAKEKVTGFETSLSTEYEEKWETGQENAVEAHTKVIETYQEGKEWVKGAKETVEKYAPEANYYGFTFGNIVKQALAHIPTIITDSTMELINPDITQETNLLSVGKAIMASKSSKLTSFVEGVMKALEKHPNEMGNISYEDAQGIIKIFKNINYDQKSISEFLENVKTNSESLESSYSNSCTTKLLIHLLIGKDKVNGLKTNASTLKTQITSILDTLKATDGLGELNFEGFTKKLDELSQMQDIGDPCPSSTGDN